MKLPNIFKKKEKLIDNKFKDGVMGHAVGDAFGVPVEFKSRAYLMENPVTMMKSNGTHNQEAGTWSDDTSMEIATISSFIEKGYFDYDDIMNNFCKWINDNEFTARGFVFDVGRTCLEAINKYSKGDIPAIECGSKLINANGNGSLMRMFPVAYYAYYKKLDKKDIYELVKNMSSLTHGHEISILGCYIYVLYTIELLLGIDKYEAYDDIKKEDYSFFEKEALKAYERILNDDISMLTVDDIKSSGYVVDSLEAALWVTLKSKNYVESIIGSANLGEDTDTIAAITGSMTGVIYGYKDIPEDWLSKIARREYLENLCDDFMKKINE